MPKNHRVYCFPINSESIRLSEALLATPGEAAACEYTLFVMPGGPGELIEKGSGDVIILSDLGHLTVDALINPNVFDNFDTGLRI